MFHPSPGDKAGQTWANHTLPFLEHRGSHDQKYAGHPRRFPGKRQAYKLSCTDAILLQEIITEPGLFHEESEHWQIVYGKREGEFRGEAIAHHATHSSHHNSQCVPGAVVTTLKLKQTSTSFRALAGHIPHHATIPATEDMLMSWGEQLTGCSRVVAAGMDANETFTTPSADSAGGIARTGRADSVLHWATQHTLTLPPQELHTPAHFPYTSNSYDHAGSTTFSPKGSQQHMGR